MKNKIKNIFENYSINLSEKQVEQFQAYCEFLIEENKKFNLTAITDEDEIVLKHFLDSCLPYRELPESAKVVDVGSGAGFPGVPLKIVRPDIEIFLVDSLAKRVGFLENLKNLLKLQNFHTFHARAEDFAKQNRETFDVAVARAVAPLNTLCEYLLPLVKVGGTAVILKSQKLDEEMKNAQKAIAVLGAKVKKVENFEYFDQKNEKFLRKILILEKIKPTPQKYPRPANKPKTSPIV